MDHQTQFNLSHILGQAVDVANYNTFQHQLHGYSNISTVGNIASFGGTTIAPIAHTVTVQDVATPAGHIAGTSGMVTMGYTHHPQSAPVQSYHAVFNNMTVTHIAPQMPPQQVQYFSYEAPSMNVRAQSLHTHHPQAAPSQPINPQAHIKYGNSSISLQAVSSSLPLNCTFSVPREQTGQSIVIKYAEGNTEDRGKKKKAKKEGISAKFTRKRRRNRGESYINVAGKFVEAKKYVERDCECKNKCLSKLGTVEDRENIFKQFWSIGDFGQQNAYLTENVILVPNVMKRRKAALLDDKHLKTVRRLYYVRQSNCGKQTRVCKTMFLNLHGVSNGRLDRVLQAINCEHPPALQDRRGHHTPSNKTSEEDVAFVIQHISSTKQTRDETHCTLSGNQHQGMPQGHILTEVVGTVRKELSVKKMYELYKRVCQEERRTPVSLWVYRHIEKSQINLENSEKNCEVLENRGIIHSQNQIVSNIDPKPVTNNDLNVCHGTSEIQEQRMDIGNVTSNISRKKRAGGHRKIMSREERKVKRNSGAAYLTASGKLKKEKFYDDKECGCKYKCIPEMGTEESRKRIFNSFWKLADFTKQNMDIAQKVMLVPIIQKDEKVIEKFTRTYTRIYNVQLKPGGELVRVCKMAFLQLHGISNGRVDRVLQAVACQSPFALKDRRGHHSPKNKTREEDISYACSHIKTFPIGYDSSETRSDGRCTLPHDLNVEKMYRMYKEQCVTDDRAPIGSFVYRKILKERFNCFIKSPANKTPEIDLEYAFKHIQSSVLESTVPHKADAPTTPATCNSQETSINKLHLDYVQKCSQEGKKPIGIDVYRKIFNSKLHLKQDICQVLSQPS
nr:uncharacterized protein LOC123754423 isoform X1 [Procambarus clarkii]XP_045592778.1 uncharacterized protein LOC123754423 isoform X1 [Procambarus clarkii]XP_045592779.1 uncharacterized protein LOC123754423 isoform X1 [Procambarus clarkii]